MHRTELILSQVQIRIADAMLQHRHDRHFPVKARDDDEVGRVEDDAGDGLVGGEEGVDLEEFGEGGRV